jgi:hypothetical protein
VGGIDFDEDDDVEWIDEDEDFFEKDSSSQWGSNSTINLTDKRLNLKNDIKILQTHVLYVAPGVSIILHFDIVFE